MFCSWAVKFKQFCRQLHRLRVCELFCLLRLPVINPSLIRANLTFSGSGGHGLPQLRLLELSNSSVYSVTEWDREGLLAAQNLTLLLHSAPYPILWRTTNLFLRPASNRSVRLCLTSFIVSLLLCLFSLGRAGVRSLKLFSSKMQWWTVFVPLDFFVSLLNVCLHGH